MNQEKENYYNLLYSWRFAPIGDPRFQGEAGKEFAEKMSLAKAKLTDEEAVQISKLVGWGQ